ncbi:unnamed protein product [Ectocarpus sp. 13 AM-2016]
MIQQMSGSENNPTIPALSIPPYTDVAPAAASVNKGKAKAKASEGKVSSVLQVVRRKADLRLAPEPQGNNNISGFEEEEVVSPTGTEEEKRARGLDKEWPPLQSSNRFEALQSPTQSASSTPWVTVARQKPRK